MITFIAQAAAAAAKTTAAPQQCTFSSCVAKYWNAYQGQVLQFAKCILLAIAVLIIARLCSAIAKKLIIKTESKLAQLDESLRKIIYTAVKILIWVLAVLVILDLFGFNTASIVTVLGAAGLTVGLAMKDSLSNVAAGIMLLVLRPYKTGDYVECGASAGTIEEMGFFSTILKTVDGIFVAVPNSTLFGSPITNYSKNETRRAVITVGISYSDNLPAAMKALREMMDKNELILKDPVPEVLVSDLADSSVNLTIRFWVKSDIYWDAYWQVKEVMKATIEDAGMTIPFPQRVITMVNPK